MKNKKKIIKIIIVNVVLIILYFTPSLYMYLHTEYVRRKFNELDLKYKEINFIKENDYLLEIYKYKILFKTDKDHELTFFESYNLDIFIDGKKINEKPLLGIFDKFSISSIIIFDFDNDSFDEIYFYTYYDQKYSESIKYTLIDFYRDNNEIKYKLTNLNDSNFISKYFYSYKSSFIGEGILIILLLFIGFILLSVHILIIIIILIIFWIRKYLKKRKVANST